MDIDAQAVEVTKLSLLLKVLEGETDQSVTRQLSGMQERALPDLDDNIKWGNSLIGPDFYDKTQASLLGEEEEYRINVFPWRDAFPEVFGGRNPGFDAVIGNPPYIRIQALKEFAPVEAEYYREAYQTAARGNYDIYVVFVEKGLSLLRKGGRLSFILPHKLFNAQYGGPLRTLVSEGRYLEEVVHFGHEQVFTGASTYTCLMFLNKAGEKEFRFTKVGDLLQWRVTGGAVEGNLPTEVVTTDNWNFVVGRGADLIRRMNGTATKLEDVTERMFQGIKTSADKIYIVEELQRPDNLVKVYFREKDGEYWLEDKLLHPLVKGGDSKRYHLSRTKRLILFPYSSGDGSVAALISASEMSNQLPRTWEYLLDYLERREHGKMSGSAWYAYGRTQALDVMPLPKIFTPDIALRASFSLDETGEAFFTSGVAGGYGVLVKSGHSREYILGLLNSRLLEWLLRQSTTPMRGGYLSFESRYIRGLPIVSLDGTDPTRKALHDQVVVLVEKMMGLHQRLSVARSPNDRNLLQRQIRATDQQIDRLVYNLYGLTDEEIEVVESETVPGA